MTNAASPTTVSGALRSGDARTALDLLLGVWRKTRAAAIGDVIHRLSARMRGNAEDAFAQNTDDDEATLWRTIAKRGDSCDLDALLERFQRDAVTGDPDVLASQLTMLAEAGDDPRFSMALAKMILAQLESRAVDADNRLIDFTREPMTAFQTRAFDHLRVLPDMRTIPILKTAEEIATRLASGDHYEIEVRLKMLIADLERTQPIPVDREWLRKIIEELSVYSPTFVRPPTATFVAPPKGADQRRAWNLLHAVYKDPNDDALRLVCGDALAEVGDPRGELIALGFKVATLPTVPPAITKRLAALIKEHGAKWLGELSNRFSLDNVSFEKGFVSALRIEGRLEWNKISGAPELSTVHTIELYRPDRYLIVDIGATPHLRLRELHITWNHANYLDALDPKTIPAFAEITSYVNTSPSLMLDEVAAMRTYFPRLTHLALTLTNPSARSWDFSRRFFSVTETDQIDALYKLFDGLTDVTLGSPTRTPSFCVNALSQLETLPRSVQRLHVHVGPEQWSLVRDDHDDRWEVTLHPRDDEFDPARVRGVLAALPDTLPIRRDNIEIPPAPAKKRKKNAKKALPR